MANHNSNYLNEDIFQYKDNVDELMEKLLLLEKVDFELYTASPPYPQEDGDYHI